MDAEKIILTKNFYELSASEKEAVKDYAKNEAEFNEIKSFLLATKQSFNQQKIQVSDNLSHSILNHLHQPIEQKKIWYNTLILFLFPKQKQFYQYPAFQIAFASLLILFIINIIPNISNKEQLAVNVEIPKIKQGQKINDEDFDNKISNEFKTSENTIKDSIQQIYIVNSEEQIETSINKNLETSELEPATNFNSTVFDSNDNIEEIQDEITATISNKNSNPTTKLEKITEVEDVEAGDIMESEQITTKNNSKKRNIKLKNDKNTSNAYRSTQDNQPVISKSEKNISIQSVSIKQTPELVSLFYYYK
jgi:hypothetical protein